MRNQTSRGAGAEGARLPGYDGEAGTIASEKLLQIIEAVRVVLVDGCTCRNDAELRGVGGQSDSMQKASEQVADLRAGRAPVAVEFINYEMKYMPFSIAFEPLPGLLENIVFNAPHQHDVEHAVICN